MRRHRLVRPRETATLLCSEHCRRTIDQLTRMYLERRIGTVAQVSFCYHFIDQFGQNLFPVNVITKRALGDSVVRTTNSRNNKFFEGTCLKERRSLKIRLNHFGCLLDVAENLLQLGNGWLSLATNQGVSKCSENSSRASFVNVWVSAVEIT